MIALAVTVSHDDLFVEIVTILAAAIIGIYKAWQAARGLKRDVGAVQTTLDEVHTKVNGQLGNALAEIDELKAHLARLTEALAHPPEVPPS